MKFALLFSMLTLSFSAFACPDLAGNYQCQSDEGAYHAVVSQRINKDGYAIYSVNGQDFAITDGTTRPMESTEEFRNGTMASVCSDSQTELINYIEGELFNEGNYAGDIEMQLTFYVGNNGDLVQRSEGEVVLPDGQRVGFGEIESCERIGN